MEEELLNPEEEKSSTEEKQEYTKPQSPYSKLPFDLKPEDLLQEGVQKMLLGEISRLHSDNFKLCDFEKRFYERDKECAVLKSKQQKDTMLEILYTVSIAIGAALIGWLPSSSRLGGSIAVLTMAIVLFIFALLAKWTGGKNES